MGTLTASGTSGYSTWLVFGDTKGEVLMSPFGTLFIDLTASWGAILLGALPQQVDFPIEPTLPVPFKQHVQAFAWLPSQSTGTLSNAATIEIE